jgi:hypothetical protein
VFVLSYIRSRVWGSIKYSGTRCGDYYLIPQRLTALIRQKILDSAVDDVSEALHLHMAPPAIQIVVIPAGVIVLLGLRNPPHSWIGTVGPSLLGFTIAPCVDSLPCYRLIRWPRSVTPRFMETRIKSLKLQLCHKVRANQVVEVWNQKSKFKEFSFWS